MNHKISEKRIPFIVASPGEIIDEELEANGWTQKDLAEIIGRPEQAISEIVNGKKQITPETAMELGRAFGTSAEFWMNLEINYQLWLARQHETDKAIDRRSRLYSLAPITELRRKGWISDTSNIDILEKEICRLLDITSPDQKPVSVVNLRSSERQNLEITSQIVWIKRVEKLVASQHPAKFDPKKLEAGISAILDHAARLEDISSIPGLLLEMGIRFAVVPHLSKTFLDGAAFRYKDNPVVALTLRYDRIDSFWFTLMHELAHHALGHKGAFLDTLYGRTEEVSAKETQADKFAQNRLIDPSAYSEFLKRSRSHFSKSDVLEFAEKQHRHPGIIVGRLQYDGHIKFNQLRQLLVKVSPILSETTKTTKVA